jgi:Ca-activated chloride channel family protein
MHRRARGGGGRGSTGGETVIENVRSDAPNPGTMSARVGEETIGSLDLVATRVKAKVTGSLASTQVTQTFSNPFDKPIEAVYTFPLPADGAVNEFVMQIGERRIIGIVRPRAEAEQAYKEARARGFTASLMTQERPNIFTQNVANIAKDMEVSVKFTFFQMLN